MHYYCLMFTGHTIPEKLRDYLFNLAQRMFTKDKSKVTFSNDFCSGQITTKFKTVGIGGMYGIKFEGVIEWENKSSNVHFICKHVDLKNYDDSIELSWQEMDIDTLFENSFSFSEN